MKSSWIRLALSFAVFLNLLIPRMRAQDTARPELGQFEGIVRDSAGQPVAAVSIFLQAEGRSNPAETKTSLGGTFVFAPIPAGTYVVTLKKPGFRAAKVDSINLAAGEKRHCEFVLQGLGESDPATGSSSAIQLDDRPNFTVAGVTDSTGSGGHGSETRIRTGEALAKEALNLKSGEAGPQTGVPREEAADNQEHLQESALRASLLLNPQSFNANHGLGELYFHSQKYREAIPFLTVAYQVNPKNYGNALDLLTAFKASGEFSRARDQVEHMLANERDLNKQSEANLRRALGDLDERLDDSLSAVREYERAVALDSSEENYFAWGAQLLLHRATAPAVDVFGRGFRLYPDSPRMLAGLGAALYTSGSIDEAAQRLCEASDLDPANPAPYLFLGKMQESSSTALPCADQKLARFARDDPQNALANYYYALVLWRRDRGSMRSETLDEAKALLEKAAAIDPKLDSADVQLGNLYSARGMLREAMSAYERAIATNPSNSEAHYRLGLVCKQLGEKAKAQREFEEYKQLDKTEAEATERRRRDLGQFLFVLQDKQSALKDPSTPAVSK
jgi:tetratricopeptide (TPR) repeat protein